MSLSDALSRAAIDPDAAILAPARAPMIELEIASVPLESARALTLAVEVEPPAPTQRWRFFVFWCLLRLAARIMRFNFEIYRPRRPWE